MTVEVWWAGIDQARDEFAVDLDEDEQRRLAAYRRDEDKARFLLGCTMVRRLLAARFSLPAAKVRLDRSCPDCGKPHGKIRADGVELSVTHSGELVGVAIGDHPVGLDVEKVDPDLDIDAVGRLCLAPEEMRGLARYDGIARAKAFTRVWTRKEAVVKATGVGVRADLQTVVVGPLDQPAEVWEWAQHTGQLTDLEVGADYAAALAVLRAEPLVVRVNDATQVLI
ncbi:4'-phosphopantetheinyl transferase superfamily protein [Kribbella sp. NBC_01484]|uniref:4'-phosphopantetheinyl transferase family protein n=1 Tax=Kribbella sp. NBC_01484 TaxID=2903579 RepID=UPI002E30DD59|nr:4'-phosphopantetheinyl transferase superfamily protein [Kribbella sp. NBC_01484]